MWTSAFHIFVVVYTSRFPMEAPQLMKYGGIIRDHNWKFYDEKPQQKSSVARAKSEGRVPAGYCFKFHRGNRCNGGSYRHNCLKCGSAHKASTCTIRSNSTSNFRAQGRSSYANKVSSESALSGARSTNTSKG